MNWPVLLAIFAVAPTVAFVIYLILRPQKAAVTANQPHIECGVPVDTPDGAPRIEPGIVQRDILEELEQAEYVATAERIKESAVRKSEELADELGNKADSLIDWTEDRPAYRPSTVDPDILMRSIGISPKPRMERGVHHVFIPVRVLQQIVHHLSSNTSVELGGLLAGVPYYAPSIDAYLITVLDAVAADGANETATSFEYTPATWRQLTPKLQQLPGEYVVVGSYHSHPGLGVFLSPTDLDTQAGVFSQDWQIALVIDPIRNETEFFISPEGTPAQYHEFEFKLANAD
jgi:proteasome lid subunit RPN8/RPN11